MPSENRSFYYLFPHVGFPKIFFENGERLYRNFTGSNSNYELNRFWSTLAEEFKINVPKTLTCSTFKLSNGRELIVIKMPDPKQITEVRFIGLLFVVNRFLFKTEITAIKYFTLELTEPKQLGHFVFGEWATTERHKNYGVLIDSSLEGFINGIKAIDANNHSLLLKMIESNNSSKTNEAGGDEIPSSSERVDDFEINQLIDFWKEKIPNELFQQAEGAFDLFTMQCSVLLNYAQMISSDKKLTKIQQTLKNDLPPYAHICMIMGVEFGDRGLLCSNDIHNMGDLPETVRSSMRNLQTPFYEMNFNLTDITSGHKPNAKAESEKAMMHFLDGQVKSFKIGVQYGYNLEVNEFHKPEANMEEPEAIELILTDLNPKKDETQIETVNKGEPEDNETYKILADVAMSDPDPNVRKQAQEGVRELFPGGPEAFDDMLIKFIEGLRDPQKRQLSMAMLPAYGDMVLPMLKMYLKDPDPDMRRVVTQVIIEIEKLRKELYS